MNEIEIPQQEQQQPITLKDNAKRAKTVMIVFGALIVIIFMGLFSSYNLLQILENAQNGKYITEQEAEFVDLIQQIIVAFQLVVYIVSIVVFLNWFRRAYGNLHRLGLNSLKHKESMAIWAWFIPFVSFFRPKEIMNTIWNTTQKQIKKYDSSYVIKEGDLIRTWWVLFIVSNFIVRIMKPASSFKQSEIEKGINDLWAILVSDILQIPEAILVVYIVYQLSKMESKLADEVKKSGGNVL